MPDLWPRPVGHAVLNHQAERSILLDALRPQFPRFGAVWSDCELILVKRHSLPLRPGSGFESQNPS